MYIPLAGRDTFYFFYLFIFGVCVSLAVVYL